MKYEDYDIEHFLTDEFFIQWVKNPNENNRHFWEKWVDQHPEKRAVVMEAVSLISAIHYGTKSAVDDRLYIETFENIIKAENDGLGDSNLTPKKKRHGFPFRQVAAALLILFGGVLAVNLVFTPLDTEEVVKEEARLIKRTNPSGKKSLITLSDGTRVYLNAASEITYSGQFSDSLRLVGLKGEAFFEVKSEDRPFVVETLETKVRVLGTSFNINQKDNGTVMVALVTGKVTVNDNDGNQVNLEPSEMMVRKRGGDWHKTPFDPLEITGWKDKMLVFKRNSFSEVKERIENWFGVEIQLKGKIKPDWTYSGIYQDETLENVLRGISLTSDLTYTIDNKENVIITNPK